ncbi:effector-associated constant component EACC1 [Streptomyces rubiginosohelvolus]|uniref:effector-associated constant component EACC1 n=1 Tax=Streptomyces rubiginosohelvolus TaxID=67362 RepID=UPI0033AAED1F
MTGDLLDILSLILGSLVSVTSFLIALYSWRSARSPDPTITIRRGGQEIILRGSDIDLEELKLLLEDQGQDGKDIPSSSPQGDIADEPAHDHKPLS